MPAELAPDMLERLDALGASVAGFEETPEQARSETWQIEILHQGEPDRSGLEDALDRIAQEVGAGHIELEIAPVPDADWLATTAAQFPPQRVGRFWIHGSHVEEPPPAGVVPIRIDAGLAFGSGDHATTRGCLVALDRIASHRRLRRVLDLGCGSGILGIAAAKCWPARIVAADNDPAAVEVARANARENGVGSRLHAVVSDGFGHPLPRAFGPYDLIVANILAAPLIGLAPDLARRVAVGGRVILSGLLHEQAERVLAAYRAERLHLERLILDDPWATLQLRPLRQASLQPRLRMRSSPEPSPAEGRLKDGSRSSGTRLRKRAVRSH
ncbi:MAG TPA: 50S ribosomal protein L11 methyltransferase [Geminicoccaceae bacterium]